MRTIRTDIPGISDAKKGREVCKVNKIFAIADKMTAIELSEAEWRCEGATRSDKTACSEFGLTQDEIIAAIRAHPASSLEEARTELLSALGEPVS